MIRFKCPYCPAGIALKDDYSGQSIRCPDCKMLIDSGYVTKEVTNPSSRDAPTEDFTYSRKSSGSGMRLVVGLGALIALVISIGVMWSMIASRKRAQEEEAKQPIKEAIVAPQAKQTKPVPSKSSKAPPKTVAIAKPIKPQDPVEPEEPSLAPRKRLPGEGESIGSPYIIDPSLVSSAFETLQARGKGLNAYYEKDLDEMVKLLPRLKKGEVELNLKTTVIPSNTAEPVSFPSFDEKINRILDCETRITKANDTIRAYKDGDWWHFVPPLDKVVEVGKCGRFIDASFTPVEIINSNTSLITFAVERASKQKPVMEYALLKNVPTKDFAINESREFHEAVIIAEMSVGQKRAKCILVPLAMPPRKP